jgi:hypothetical protein
MLLSVDKSVKHGSFSAYTNIEKIPQPFVSWGVILEREMGIEPTTWLRRRQLGKLNNVYITLLYLMYFIKYLDL